MDFNKWNRTSEEVPGKNLITNNVDMTSRTQEDVVSSFFYYMWNCWCKEECETVYGSTYTHFWEKWCYYADRDIQGAAECFYADLSNSNRRLLVERACKIYDEKGFRIEDPTERPTSSVIKPDDSLDDIQKIIFIANELGWNVQSNMENGNTQFDFSQYTPAGQDFNFSAEMTENMPDTLVRSIKDFYESFDVDEEAYLWIGEDGHGNNGAPYNIKDIVHDMKVAKEMVYQLYTDLRNAF